MQESLEIPNWQDLPLESAYPFAEERGLGEEVADIRAATRGQRSRVRRGLIVELLDRNGLFQEFKDAYWPNGNTPNGQRRVLTYLRRLQAYREEVGDYGEEIEPDEDRDTQQFAAESDLRDFVARNLQIIESGLRLFQDSDKNGIEFPVDGGRIDILAIEQTGRLVVIELKVSRGRNRTVGQILYYMGWVDSNLASEPCRGVIIAKDISDDLRLACQRIPDIALYKYALSVTLERVSPT